MTYRQLIGEALDNLSRPLSQREILDYIYTHYPGKLKKKGFENSFRVIFTSLKNKGEILSIKPWGLCSFYYKPSWEVKGEVINNHALDSLNKKYVHVL